MNYLIVVDMQNDFVTGSLGTAEAKSIVPAVARRVARALEQGEEVVFTRDTHGPDYLNTQEGRRLPVSHCIHGTEGWEIIPQLSAYTAGRTPINKPTFGSRYLGAMLKARDEDLRKQGQPGVERATFIGLCTDICVISNALLVKAFLPEVEIVVDAACCAGVTAASHKNALEAMKMCQVVIENG